MRDQDHLVPPQMIEQVSDIVCHGGHRVIARWAVRRVPETTHVHGAAQAVGAQSRTEVNRSRMSRIRTFVKKVEAAIATGNATEAQNALKSAQPEIMRGVSKGVLPKATASRKVSRLAARVKALAA